MKGQQGQSKAQQSKQANHAILRADNRTSRRTFIDKATAVGVTLGGSMVFIALLLIFFYLLYVVKPIFAGAELTPAATIPLAASQRAPLMLGMDEQNEIVFRVTAQGHVSFYRVLDGQLLATISVPLPEQVKVTTAAVASESEQLFVLGLSNGTVLPVKVAFATSYPDNVRLITPTLRYPLGSTPLALQAGTLPSSAVRAEQEPESSRVLKTASMTTSSTEETSSQPNAAKSASSNHISRQAVTTLAVGYQSDRVTLAYQDALGHWQLTRLVGEENMMTETISWHSEHSVITDAPAGVSQALMTPDQQQLLLRSHNRVFIYDIRRAKASLLQVLDLSRDSSPVTGMALLAGASSILLTHQSGEVGQYFQVPQPNGRLYQHIRDFNAGGAVAALATEFYRKSFATLTQTGALTLHYTTSERQLLHRQLKLGQADAMAFSPRGSALVVESGAQLQVFAVENAHPEVSLSALWQKVWYEGYPQPQYVWQSTSGSDDFEAKLSLMPLVFGTMKAALYAMLFAVPLAIAGAVYTAYFMSSKVRALVKPTIEIMEALPTVILGFLAGLWLAPLVEENLPGIVLLLLMLPLTVVLTALGWYALPGSFKRLLPQEYRELMLLPILCLVGWGCFSFSPVLELWLFAGDSRRFITNELGITFDQRNALVVGIAMGFAVIPTIFSIAEDAVFSVPRQLANGSLALGATQWQTLTRVVLLTASPGIFSAVMMGLGRAVGETMIVLMATGNTPIMQWSVFEGMRTLAANIAVEMPESAIGSTHYRVLFLAAFVLFIFTFVFNTLAEVVRQRLRARYSAL